MRDDGGRPSREPRDGQRRADTGERRRQAAKWKKASKTKQLQAWVKTTSRHHPNALTPQQAARSIMVMFEGVNTFQIRYAISGCCTTGRNFLFGGCARHALATRTHPRTPLASPSMSS